MFKTLAPILMCVFLAHVCSAGAIEALHWRGSSEIAEDSSIVRQSDPLASDTTLGTEGLRPWVSIGSPFLLNVGAKVNVTDSYFVEGAFPVVLGLVAREGYFSAAFGALLSDGRRSHTTRMAYEASVMIGVSEPFFGPKSMFVGFGFNMILKFGTGFCMFLRPTPIYFTSGSGGLTLDLGLGWSF